MSGNTVTLASAGYCTIQAAQAGNGQYNPAPNVTQSFPVLQVPVFTSGPPPNGRLGVPYNFTITVTGYPPSDFVVMTGALPPGLTLDRTTGIISGTPSAAGTFTGSVSAINGSVSPSPSQAFSIVIGTFAGQAISFGSLGNRVFGTGAFGVTATASSGLPVSFASLTPGVCTVAGSIVTLVAGGTCTIQASQPGNGNYAAAPSVNQSFIVTPASQTISFGALADKPLCAQPLTVSAAASSGLAVTFSSLTSSICMVSGSTITLATAGTCTIRASQVGNASYNAAPTIDRSFAVLSGAEIQYLYDLAGNLTQVTRVPCP